MDSSQIIKAIIPHYCPNCNQEIFVKVHTLPPVLASVLNRADILNAKYDVMKMLEKSGMTQKKLETIRVEIMNEAILFGPEDTQGIVDQYLKDL